MSFNESGQSFGFNYSSNHPSNYQSNNPYSNYQPTNEEGFSSNSNSNYTPNYPTNQNKQTHPPYQFNQPNYQPNNQQNYNFPTGQYQKGPGSGYPNQSETVNFAGIPALNQEDMAIAKQAYQEAFFKRCVPLSVLSCSTIFMLSKRGMIKPSGVKYFVALTASYFLGNWSYRNIMRDRIINSNSDSPFAQSLRRSFGRREIFMPCPKQKWDKPTYPAVTQPSSPGWKSTSEFAPDDDNHFDSSNYFGESKLEDILDDNKSKVNTTYDELRMKNRANFKF